MSIMFGRIARLGFTGATKGEAAVVGFAAAAMARRLHSTPSTQSVGATLHSQDGVLEKDRDSSFSVAHGGEFVHTHSIPLLEPSTVGFFTDKANRATNEDRVVIGTAGGYNVVGVFDGHGGAEAVDFVREHLLTTIEGIASHDPTVAPEELLQEAFLDINDRLFEHMSGMMSLEEMASGSTGTVVITPSQSIGSEKVLTFANVGDSRLLLLSNGQAQQLTPDHRPSNPDELARIINSGGRVTFTGIPRVDGKLAMTRAFGAFHVRAHGVTAEPAIGKHVVDAASDGVLIMGTDGIFDELTNEEVCQMVATCSSPHEAASTIGDAALTYHANDNVTAIVAPLPGWANPANRTLPEFTYNRHLARKPT